MAVSRGLLARAGEQTWHSQPVVWEYVTAVLGGLVTAWLALVLALFWVGRRQDDPARLTGILRLVPDVIGLLRRLAADGTLPKGTRSRLALLTAYLLLPFDLVPDFIPVVGYADDALIVVWALRSVIKAAGAEALDRHWAGTDDGLDALKRLAGVAT